MLHNQERYDELLIIYTVLFTHFSVTTLEDNLIETKFLGLSISDTIDCNLHELLPTIKSLHDKGKV